MQNDNGLITVIDTGYRIKVNTAHGIDEVWEVGRDTSVNPVQLPDNDFLKCVFWSSASPDFACKRQESSTMNFRMYQALMEVTVFYTCSYNKTYSI